MLTMVNAQADKCSPAFQAGRAGNDTILVLAAPGRREAVEGRPAAGQTGRNLEALLAHLNALRPEDFPSTSRLDYTIVNSVEAVMFGARSLPYRSEIASDVNVTRLIRQLAGGRIIVAFGDCAIAATRAAGREPVFCAPHPGLQAINPLFEGIEGDKQERYAERIRRLAELLLSSQGRCDELMEELRLLRKVRRENRPARPGPVVADG